MSDDDDFIRFLKDWARNFINRNDSPKYINLERKDNFGDWSERFLSQYEKKESGKEAGEDSTIALIEKVTSDVISYIDEVEGSKKSKKKR